MTMQRGGGAAFPRPVSVDTRNGTLPDGDSVVIEQDGMTLRDYFAAKALPSVIAILSEEESWTYEEAARDAYDIADTMLETREK